MRPILTIAFALAAALPACASEPPVQPDVPSTTQVSIMSGPVDSGELDDPRVATIAEQIRDGLEERARVAIDRSKTAAVRGFAKRVLADDPGVSITMMDLGPRTSILGEEVASNTAADASALRAASDGQIDRAFLDDERRAIDAGLRLLDARLIPSAKSPQLRDRLREMAATLSGELHDLDAMNLATPSTPRPK